MKKLSKTDQAFKELISKLNALALDVIDEIYQARFSGRKIDFDSLRAPLLAIKEIKDLVKINDRLRESEVSDLLGLEIDDLTNELELEDLSDEKITIKPQSTPKRFKS